MRRGPQRRRDVWERSGEGGPAHRPGVGGEVASVEGRDWNPHLRAG